MKRVTRIRARAALDAVLLEVGAVGSLVLIGSLSAMGQVSAAFTNPSAITILDYATASPYPSQITVSNLVGPISKLTATMNGFTHTFPSDVGVLLVGPAGQGIVLMNDAGNNAHGAATNLTLTFDQSAANPPGLSTPLTNGVYQPSDYGFGRSFALPAPTGPYASSLDDFNGTNPNGAWSLFVEDFSPGDSGVISNSWSLTIIVEPALQPVLGIARVGDMLKISVAGGATNALCTLQGTSNLQDWGVVGKTTSDASGSAEFDVDLVGAAAAQFYRVLVK
jgi:subtilisin-like proprotein convertase family protein